jgi:uncharacterized membrane protein
MAETHHGSANVAPGERVLSTVIGSVLMAVAAGKGRSLATRTLAGAVGSSLALRGMTGHSRLYEALGKTRSHKFGKGDEAAIHGAADEANEVERTITIGRPREDLYRMFRNPETVSRVMGHFAQVTGSGERKHWRVEGPLGKTLEWEERLVEDRPGEFLKWESLPGADVPTDGWIRFREAPRGWGTEVTLSVRFTPPGGAAARSMVRLFGIVPHAVTMKALRRFKSLAETGEFPTTNANPAARHGGSST